MNDIPARYPYLDNFLGSEFIQDPDDHRSLLEVADDFTRTREPENVLAVAMDIRRFLKDQHNDIETAFESFIPQIRPLGMGYTTTAWLSEIADLMERPQRA